MRMRRKPWARPELDACDFYVKNPDEHRGKWNETFIVRQPLIVELGCGKGNFICHKAYMHRDCNFVAVDIKSEMLGLAKRNIEKVYGDDSVDNVRLTAKNVEKISEIFSEDDDVQELYINFCNPWPKAKHQKRRLTFPKQLNQYKEFLRKDGKLYFKTDDDLLFADTLEYLKECDFEIEFITYDNDTDSLPENIETEHEKMFKDQGIKIKGLIAVNKKCFLI